jgi:hypothetical protein
MSRRNPLSTIDALVADLEPVSPITARGGVSGTAVAAAVAISVSTLGLGLRGDVAGGRLDPLFLISAGLFLLLACAASWSVVQMGRPQVGNHQTGWLWACAMTALLPVSAAVTLSAKWLSGVTPHIDSYGLICLQSGVSLGLFVAVALTLWLRGGAPTSLVRAGLLTGIAAGGSGIFAVTLHCPINDIAHIGVWHSLVVVISALAGRVIIPAAVRW